MQKETFKIFGIPVYSRSIDTGPLPNASEEWKKAIIGDDTDSGVNISVESGITISAVWRAVNVVSGTLAFLPVGTFRKNENGGRDSLPNHKVQELLDYPCDEMHGFTFRQTLQACKMLWGNGYALIGRKDGWANELIVVHPDDCEPMRDAQGDIYYHIRIDNKYFTFPSKDVIHLRGLGFDGLKGKSVIQIQRESLGLTKAAETYGARFFGKGTNMSGVIEVPGTLKDDVYNRLKESWEEKYRGLHRSHSTPILEAGSTYKRIGIPPEDAQFLQTRKFQLAEVARWYGVQPHLLFDLERSTNNNIEHQGMEFVTYTLAQEIALWEGELRRKLFSSEQRKSHYVEFNINALLRADSQARAEYYSRMFSIAAMNPNQIRKLENDPAYDGGDTYYVNSTNVPVDLIGKVHKEKLSKDEE